MKKRINSRIAVNSSSVKTVRLAAVLFVIFTVALSGCVDRRSRITPDG